jgi:hypothetical protein
VPANPTGLVYGTITVAALLAAESARQETYPRTVGAVALTLLLYWLAYSYAQFTGERLAENEPFSLGRLGRSAVQELAVLLGAVIPLLVLLILWAFGTSLADAVTAGIWTSAAMVVLCEVVIGIRAELSGRELALQTLMGALLGLMVIALRVLLH